MEGIYGDDIKLRLRAVRLSWLSGGVHDRQKHVASKGKSQSDKTQDASYTWIAKQNNVHKSKHLNSNSSDAVSSQNALVPLPTIHKGVKHPPKLSEKESTSERSKAQTRPLPLFQSLIASKHHQRTSTVFDNDKGEGENRTTLDSVQEFLAKRKEELLAISAKHAAICGARGQNQNLRGRCEPDDDNGRMIHQHRSSTEVPDRSDNLLVSTSHGIVDNHESTTDVVGNSVEGAASKLKTVTEIEPKENTESGKQKNCGKRKSVIVRNGRALDFHRSEAVTKESSLAVSTWNLVVKTGAGRFDFTSLHEFCRLLVTNDNLTHLNLSGARIMLQGAKVLATALPCVTGLTMLNLASNELRAEGMAALGTSFLQLTALRALSLYGNLIGDAGLESLAASFCSHPHVEELDLGGNQISDASHGALKIILDVTTQLSKLLLASNVTHFSFRESKGSEFAEALSKSFANLTSLTHLDLSCNCLFHSGARFVSRYLYTIKHLGILKALDLGGQRGVFNRIGPAGMKSLGAALYWMPLTDLNLSYNELGEEGSQSLATATCANSCLKSLNLRGNQIKSGGMKFIQNIIQKHSGIAYLDLAENSICYESAENIANSISSLTALTHLDLSYNLLTTWRGKAEERNPKGIAAICESLSCSATTSLQFLNFAGNKLDGSCRPYLVKAVLIHNAMHSMNGFILSGTTNFWELHQTIDDFDIFFVARRLWQSSSNSYSVHNIQLKGLDLSGCNLTDFPEAILTLRGLESMQLSRNFFRHIPVEQLLQLRFLCRLDLKDCPFLMQPPRYGAGRTSEMTLSYLQGCKKSDPLDIPMILIGDNLKARSQLITAIKASEILPTQDNAKALPSQLEIPKGYLSDSNQEECVHRWKIPGQQATFDIWNLGSVMHLKVVQELMFVPRAIYTFCLGENEHHVVKEVNHWLGILLRMVPRAVVVFTVMHDPLASQEALQSMCQLVMEATESWSLSHPNHFTFVRNGYSVCIDHSHGASVMDLIPDLALATKELIGNSDCIHGKHQRFLQQLQEYKDSNGCTWLDWRDFRAIASKILPLSADVVIMAAYLHGVGAIRCIFRADDADMPMTESWLGEQRPVGESVFIQHNALIQALHAIPASASQWAPAELVAWIRERLSLVGRSESPTSRRFASVYAAAKHKRPAALPGQLNIFGDGILSPELDSDSLSSLERNMFGSYLRSDDDTVTNQNLARSSGEPTAVATQSDADIADNGVSGAVESAVGDSPRNGSESPPKGEVSPPSGRPSPIQEEYDDDLPRQHPDGQTDAAIGAPLDSDAQEVEEMLTCESQPGGEESGIVESPEAAQDAADSGGTVTAAEPG